MSYLAKSPVGDVFRRAVDDHLDLIEPLVQLVVLVHKLAEGPGRVHAGHIGGVPGQVATGLLWERSGHRKASCGKGLARIRDHSWEIHNKQTKLCRACNYSQVKPKVRSGQVRSGQFAFSKQIHKSRVVGEHRTITCNSEWQQCSDMDNSTMVLSMVRTSTPNTHY